MCCSKLTGSPVAGGAACGSSIVYHFSSSAMASSWLTTQTDCPARSSAVACWRIAGRMLAEGGSHSGSPRQRPLPIMEGALLPTGLPAARAACVPRCRAPGLLMGAAWTELDPDQDADGHQQPGREQDVNGEAEDGQGHDGD